MTFHQQVAKFVANNLNRDADRYEQIWSIKSALLAHGYTISQHKPVDSALLMCYCI